MAAIYLIYLIACGGFILPFLIYPLTIQRGFLATPVWIIKIMKILLGGWAILALCCAGYGVVISLLDKTGGCTGAGIAVAFVPAIWGIYLVGHVGTWLLVRLLIFVFLGRVVRVPSSRG